MTKPVSTDGLVCPEAFPVKAAEIDPEAVESAGEALKAMGKAVDDEMDAIVSAWKGLPAVYEAPEAEAAYALMDPAAAASDQVRELFGQAGKAVVDFAALLSPIKKTLEELEKEAVSFRKEALKGYGGKPWIEHKPAVERNRELVGRYAQVLEQLTTASSSCAFSISRLRKDVCRVPPEAIPASAVLESGELMPWGAPVEERLDFWESVGHGGMNFLRSTWNSGRAMFGFDDNGFSVDRLRTTWVGMADFGVTAMLTGSLPLRWAVQLFGNDSVDAEVNRRVQEGTDAVWEQFGYDAAAGREGGDPWHRYRENGVATFTESALGIGTAFLGGAAAPGRSLKIAAGQGVLSRLAVKGVNGAASLLDSLVPGGSHLVKGGVGLTNGATDLAGLTDKFVDAAKRSQNPAALGAGGGHLVDEADDSARRALEEGRSSNTVRGSGRTGLELTEGSTAPRYNPEEPVTETWPAKKAPRRYTQDDVQDALDNAPRDRHGRPVDHRTGLLLRLENGGGESGVGHGLGSGS